MSKDLAKISTFIAKHHVMSLATTDTKKPNVCSLFYAYDESKLSFVVASSVDTLHVKNILQNSAVAGNIFLETQEIGKIEGLQFEGTMTLLNESNLKKFYFKRFPYALAMMPKLWQIKVDYFKLTDNRLGFGKKIIYSSALA
ncbi:pyridoxamine 5'-phosphate oxidase family protein [Sulfurimonas autotrophica]|uniref:Pyridoxamine 5'-phosphate oxidase-related FMN-binding protein n=1 Tax=Sulfurimonas autotrophica (strain ATCC BAA-671 / DSM 16294 / JCM 11897 / OK10) TaxID=563040 RepID=E0UPF4_SULAO|nr:pyridoxamine 5'-phosphate oxidase family protein [Sulfurimonas autotrophica]ADN09684.1 pyridoxamine 5'-phosphate oxidase-related FMN-binding protein [Sulfurimonas autotrophica DSM 16294]